MAVVIRVSACAHTHTHTHLLLTLEALLVHGRSLHDVVARAQHDLQQDVEGRRQRQHDEDEERGRAARGRTQHTGAADTGRIAGVARQAQDAAAVGRARKSFTERTLSVDGTAILARCAIES